jgi:hypothetical protein
LLHNALAWGGVIQITRVVAKVPMAVRCINEDVGTTSRTLGKC